MTVSRASASLLALLIAGAALPPAALAQDRQQEEGAAAAPLGAPVQLGPRIIQPAAPVADSPAAAPPVVELAPPPVNNSLTAAPIQVETLGAVDPDSVGVIDADQGGFPIGMWQGVSRVEAARLLSLLPRRVASPAMRDLTRRLLMTRASAPAGKVEGESLLSRRVSVLFAMGDIPSALALLRNAPPSHDEDSLVRTEVEGYFLLNDNAGACRQVRAQSRERNDLYWQEAVAYCLALAGQPAKAALVADILAERGDALDPAFFAAMDAIGGLKTASLDSLAAPRALHVAMLRAANVQLPKDAAEAPSAALLRAIAVSPNAPFDLRLDAAERSLAAGALTPETLREIYASVPADPAAADKPLTYAEQSWGPAARALLTRSAAGQNVPTARAEALQRGYRLGLERGGYKPFVMASLPHLLAIEPAGELSWFARDAGAALFAAGQIEDARRWWLFVRDAAPNNDDARAAAQVMWPLAHLAGIAADEDVAAARAAWWAGAKGDPTAVGRAQKQFALAEALGEQVDPALWRAVLGDGQLVTVNAPGPAIRHALVSAATGGRLAETVALALILLGEAGPDAAGSIAVEEAIRALRAIGLEKDARMIAVEAAVAGGL